jgi:hypothetical protein
MRLSILRSFNVAISVCTFQDLQGLECSGLETVPLASSGEGTI